MDINDDFTIIVQCPNCYEFVVVKKSELNCKIFRHGILKSNYEQIDPHLPKEECDKLIKNDLIFGCGKPFKILEDSNKYSAIICDYI